MYDASSKWILALSLSLLALAAACSDGPSASPQAGGGAPAASGVPATGGSVAQSGGASQLGGASYSGGSQSLGGASPVASGGNTPAGGASSGGTSTGGSSSTGGASNNPEPASKNWVYIMLGQSNMQGASPRNAADQEAPARVFKLTQDKTWVPASEGVCLWGGELSPSRSFGVKILEKVSDPEVNIFLINAAVGGTAIAQWNPQNGEHYLNMLPYLEAGMQKGTVRGFIWHQGESDTDTTTEQYAARFTELVQAIRTKVGDPVLPVVAGQIGTGGDDGAVNDALATVAATDPKMRVSSSLGLQLIPGDVHYDGPSERLMGEKMATEWWSILGQ